MLPFPEVSSARASASLFATSASCSVDALECVVHFTGAGADACFYANHPITTTTTTATPPPEGLRYWLNPSVRARPTIATCEITNLGAPFFSPISTATLRLSTSPLLTDRRCFPVRCVVSLATSAQRLDGVSVRPVVVKEWDLNAASEATVPASVFNPALQACTTEIPLRTLYHVAALMGSSTVPDMNALRLYLQLRFSGCTDTSDTHRIAAVHLAYEHLGPAAEVLPLLQRRRRNACIQNVSATADKSTGAFYESNFVEEVEVSIPSSSSSEVRQEDAAPRTPPGRSEKRIFIPNSDAANELDSPPRRSATKPRAEKSSSLDRGGPPAHHDSHTHIKVVHEVDGKEQHHDSSEAELVRVERTLRLSPPPPLTTASTTQHCAADEVVVDNALHDLHPPLRGAPWPPRKTRTIVLAPSISPSLSSTSGSGSDSGSGSLLSSPRSGAGSTPLSHSPVTCDAKPLTAEEAEAKTLSLVTDPNAKGSHLGSSARKLRTPDERQTQAEGPSSAVSSSSPPPRQRSESVDLKNSEEQAPPYPNAYGRENLSPSRSASTVQESGSARTNLAVLWEATSLLGTAPWKLRSLQSSRRTSLAESAASSRASSRERASSAPTHESSAAVAAASATAAASSVQSGASVSFLPLSSSSCPPTAWRETRRTHTSLQEPPPPPPSQTASHPSSEAGSNLRFLGWRQAGERSVVTAVADTSASSSFFQWRSASAHDASSRVHPQLHPPRSNTGQTSSFVSQIPPSLPTAASTTTLSFTNSPSACVPRLCFRRSSRRDAPAPQSSRTTTVRESVAARTGTAPPPPPSQNRDLWTRPDRETAATANAQHVMAECGQPNGRRRQSASSTAAASKNASTSQAAPSAAFPVADDKEAVSGPLSVIHTSWLQNMKTQSTQSKQRDPIMRRASMRAKQNIWGEHAAAAAAAMELTNRQESVALTSASAADAPLTETSATVVPPPPPPPPSPPPPQNRVLFHSSTSSLHSSRSNSADADAAARLPSPPLTMTTQRNDAETPALPLQEQHHLPRRALRDASHRVPPPQRRSRSAPDPRPAWSSSSSAPDVALLNKQRTEEGGTQTFAVLKHHASRNGVGRRRLTIRRVTSRGHFQTSAASAADPSDARFFIALEKVRGAAQLRDSIGLGRGRTTRDGSFNPVCEVPILRGDVVEVWTGGQAFQSGVIHKEKVRRAECCLVIRCNRQLVTAVEMETAQAVDAVARLLMATR